MNCHLSNDRKWKFRLFFVLRYVKQMFSFWGFWNFCFQFVSFGCFGFRGVLIINTLKFRSRFSRRRLWSLERFYRDCSSLLSRLRHMRLSQGTLRRDLHGCSSLVIPYHHTILILRGCHSPCHFSWWRQRYLRSHHRLYYRSSIWFSSRNGRQDYQLSAG